MRRNFTRLVKFLLIALVFLSEGVYMSAYGQYCTDPLDSIYGMNSSGQIAAINVNDAGATAIGNPTTGAKNSNVLGFSTATQKFYFFNQTGGSTTQFVSYSPRTGSFSSLAIPSSPALPTNNAGQLKSGTVNNSGTGFYMIFPGATTSLGYPKDGPALYYYDIILNTWTLITQTFKDINGNDVSTITSLNSGDMSFDGAGNLWLLCSSSSKFALFRINAPVSTTPVASITVDTAIASTSTPGGKTLAGVAFNSAGVMYLTSINGLNSNLYKIATPTSPITLVGTLPGAYGQDLTSCVYPFSVLPISYFQFSSAFNNDAVQLTWKVDETSEVSGYNVERSTDGINWEKIANVPENYTSSKSGYTYSDYNYNAGNNFYRVAQVAMNGSIKYSYVRKAIAPGDQQSEVNVHVSNNSLEVFAGKVPGKFNATIYDNVGRLMVSGITVGSGESINIGRLNRGIYIVQFSDPSQNKNLGTSRFIKF